jgi:hypothetical protein
MTEEEPDLLFWEKVQRELDRLHNEHGETMKLIAGARAAIANSYTLLHAVNAAEWGAFRIGPSNREGR